MLLWSGQVISSAGSGMSDIVLPLLILAITASAANPTGDTALAGFVEALATLPYVVLSLPVGALIDRLNRKHVMMVCDTFRALNAASIPVALYFDVLSTWQLLVNALVEGTFYVFFNIAQVAALPRVVARPLLPQATAQNEGGFIAANLVGPPVGTFLFQHIGRAFPFVVDALSYATSVFSLGLIRAEFQGERPVEKDLRRDIREGIAWIWNQPLIRYMAFLSGGVNFVKVSTFLIVIVVAKDMGASESEVGFVVSTAALGGLIGSALGGQIQRRFTFGQVIVALCWLAPLVYSLYLWVPNLALLGVVMALYSVIGPIYNVVQFSYRIALIPDRLQGRVNSTFRLIAFGFQPLGAALSGILLKYAGASKTILLYLAVLVLLGICTALNTSVREAPAIEELQSY
jgi:MFS family permease